MNNNEYVLNEVNKGIKMGMDSISNISEKIQDQNFKDDLQYQYNKYNEVLNKINNQLSEYGNFPKELNPMQKAMGWMSVEFNTLDNKSNSKISEMMIKGTNMGIIEGVKLLNNYTDIDTKVKDILNEFVKVQENNVERLKKFL
jgi:phosphoglycerate-specific signal transduction histidine kinase